MDELDNITDDFTWTISDRYVVMDRIGTGGMAEIFRAKMFGAAGFEKEFAIKLIRPHLLDDEEFVEMFVNEAKLSVALYHTNIVQVFDFGIFNERYYIVMEYVEGKDLLDILARCVNNSIRIPLDIALHIIMEMLKGLDFAHRATDVTTGESLNIIHRDISPSNILVSYSGGVKIGDFGVAKARLKQSMSRTGTLKGKVGYMSPEQVIGDPIDYRSDIFAAGIILYETISMTRLFRAENDFGTMLKVRDCDLDEALSRIRPLPSQLEAILRKALAKDLRERYQTAGAFFQDLSNFCYQNRLIIDNAKVSNIMRRLFSSDIERQKRKRAAEQSSLKQSRALGTSPHPVTHLPKPPKHDTSSDLPDIPTHDREAAGERYPTSNPRIPSLALLEAAQKKAAARLEADTTDAHNATDAIKAAVESSMSSKLSRSRHPKLINDDATAFGDFDLEPPAKQVGEPISLIHTNPERKDLPKSLLHNRKEDLQKTDKNNATAIFQDNDRTAFAAGDRTAFAPSAPQSPPPAIAGGGDATLPPSSLTDDANDKTSLSPSRLPQMTLGGGRPKPNPHVVHDTSPNSSLSGGFSKPEIKPGIGKPGLRKTGLDQSSQSFDDDAFEIPSVETKASAAKKAKESKPLETDNDRTVAPLISSNRQFRVTAHPLEIPDRLDQKEALPPQEDFPFASLEDISDEISTVGRIRSTSQSDKQNRGIFSSEPSPPIQPVSTDDDKDPDKERLRSLLEPYHEKDFYFRDLQGRIFGPLEGNQLFYFITSSREGDLSFDSVQWEPMAEFSEKVINEASKLPDVDTQETARKPFDLFKSAPGIKPSLKVPGLNKTGGKPKRPPLPPPFKKLPLPPRSAPADAFDKIMAASNELGEISSVASEEGAPSEVRSPLVGRSLVSPSMAERHKTAHNGSFAQVSFTRLLYRLLKSHQTGRLLLTSGNTKKELYFEKGRPVSVMSNLDHERLGDFLLERNLITREDLDEALERTKKWGGRLGDSLVANNVIPSYQIVNYLRMQFEEKLLEIFAWVEGDYQFYENQVTSERNHALNLDLLRVIADGCLTRIPYDYIVEFYENRQDKAIQLTEEFQSGLDRFKLKPSAVRILRSFKSGDSIFDIESRTPEDKLELTYRVLYLMHQSEFLLFENTDRVESPGFYFDTIVEE